MTRSVVFKAIHYSPNYHFDFGVEQPVDQEDQELKCRRAGVFTTALNMLF
jgi:hypothetical protein